MICDICFNMLRGQYGRKFPGSFDLTFDHHPTISSLRRSVDMPCSICRRIWDDRPKEWETWEDAGLWEHGQHHNQWSVNAHIDRLAKHLVKKLDTQPDQLAKHSEKKNEIYCLDFTLNGDAFAKNPIGIQLLRPTENESSPRVYTPEDWRLDSKEVLNLAKFWIRKCTGSDHPNCPGLDSRVAANHKSMQEVDGNASSVSDSSSALKLRRADTNTLPDPPFYPTRLLVLGEANTHTVKLIDTTLTKLEGHYVTLSHCWGERTETNKFFCLDSSNLHTYISEGIPLNKFPRTFFDAIHFARQLSTFVKYIWIDSLCIIQGDRDDWLHESTKMYKVYGNSYCNISATAAADSTKGLYLKRDPRLLGDNVDFNTAGVDSMGDSPNLQALIRRCKIVDPSMWHRKVDAAPINKRAWVLQERLLAPRVLHFCKDQIAWECGTLEASESAHPAIDNLEIKFGVIQERIRLKSLVADFDNRRTPDERWKKIVERYSLTDLTDPKDKVVALAGIAEQMSTQIGDQAPYVAGMWKNRYLASQLLWRVDPQWKNARFLYPSTRPKEFRAPSFSWAAIDAPQGIRCGETQDERLSITVTEVNVNHDAKFGVVQKPAFIKLHCQTVSIRITRALRGDKEDVFTWTLTEKKVVHAKQVNPSVYLDSPGSDFETFNSSNMWLVPASKNSSGGLVGLLLQQIEDDDKNVVDDKGNSNHFRRVGLSVISNPISSKGAFMDDNGVFTGVERREIVIF